MNNNKKVKVLNINRNLIEIYAELKKLEILTGDAKVQKALKLIDKATDLLSDI